jgi:hypothetical protein
MIIQIEYDLSGSVVPDYSMYSEIGNAAVHAIVVAARANQLNWVQTVRALRQLADQDDFGEAMDTAVREIVYHTLGFDNSEQPFYVIEKG